MRTAILRECEFAALDAMLIAIFTGEATSLLLPSDSVPSAQSLASISMDEAASIGHLFRLVLGQSRVVDSVLPQITGKYPAMSVTDGSGLCLKPSARVSSRAQCTFDHGSLTCGTIKRPAKE